MTPPRHRLLRPFLAPKGSVLIGVAVYTPQFGRRERKTTALVGRKVGSPSLSVPSVSHRRQSSPSPSNLALPNAPLAQLQNSATYSILPPHHQESWLHHAETLGARGARPETGESFESLDSCLQRLNDWGFVEGAAYVTLKTNAKDIVPNWVFACDAHSNATANKRLRHGYL
jgi:hypothetical protein